MAGYKPQFIEKPFIPAGIMRRRVLKGWYEIRPHGFENIPAEGAAVLLCNGVTPFEGIFLEHLLKTLMMRDVYFVVSEADRDRLQAHRLTKDMRTLCPQMGEDRTEYSARSIAAIKEQLGKGYLVCVFAEEGVHYEKSPVVLRRDLQTLSREINSPVIPLYIDPVERPVIGEWQGTYHLTRPQVVPCVKSVIAGKPMDFSGHHLNIKGRILELGIVAAALRRNRGDLLHARFIRIARGLWSSFCMADSTGKELTYGKSLIAGMLIARLLKKTCPNDRMIGVMLPPTAGGTLTNLGILLAGKIPVNLNFLAGDEAINSAIEQCGIKTVITSKKFLEKIAMPVREEMIFLEELMTRISSVDKVWSALMAKLLPASLLCRIYAYNQTPDDMATVIFSSGTTGIPKGVMLSHQNILSNVESFVTAVDARDFDKIMAVLPHFHSFGFTCTIWFPLLAGIGVVYHPNPMDAKVVGEMVYKYKATILVGTPTFLGAYVRKCPEYHFESLRYAIVGAEKLRESIRLSFVEKYKMELLEGYGCTEMAPVVSVNVYDGLRIPELQTGHKPGTIGHPVPGVVARIMHPETGEMLPPHQEGVLLVNGPNKMLGYLNQPERTAEVMKDGWYITGDIASIDEDGFIRITDRISRFSKIGGEMVPHGRIEDEVSTIVNGLPCAVTAVHDERKGERLVVLYANEEIEPFHIWDRLSQSSLPKLWIPRKDNIYPVSEIPVIGTGKMDLRQVKELAVRLIEKQETKPGDTVSIRIEK